MLQSAVDNFTALTEAAVTKFKEAFGEMYGSFELMKSSYDQLGKERDRYIADYKKTYELNKLNRDLQKSIDETTNSKAKQELTKLQDELNKKLQDGTKMSQYDLDLMQKRIETKKAEIALEEAQNAKNQVRLVRNSTGEYGYMYTANQEEISKAQQSYEDALYAEVELTQNYLKQLEADSIAILEEWSSTASDIT
jgi:exonuclease VII large subunit